MVGKILRLYVKAKFFDMSVRGEKMWGIRLADFNNGKYVPADLALGDVVRLICGSGSRDFVFVETLGFATAHEAAVHICQNNLLTCRRRYTVGEVEREILAIYRHTQIRSSGGLVMIKFRSPN